MDLSRPISVIRLRLRMNRRTEAGAAPVLTEADHDAHLMRVCTSMRFELRINSRG